VESTSSPRPLLLGAFLCEKVLEEKDGILSAVRIFDRLAVLAPTEALRPLVAFTLLVMIRRGTAQPNHSVTVDVMSPSGVETALETHPIVLTGEPDEGVNMRIEIQLGATEEGLYWIRARLDADDLHLIPLRITFVPPATPGSPQGSRAESANQS
jgi:hypothetical protein